jgi:hypothetical protein
MHDALAAVLADNELLICVPLLSAYLLYIHISIIYIQCVQQT